MTLLPSIRWAALQKFFHTGGRLLLFWLAVGTSLAAAEAWPERLRLGSDHPYSVFIEPGATLNIAQVARLADASFLPVKGGLALSYTHNAAWLRVDLPARLGPSTAWLLEVQPSFLDSVQVYEADASEPTGWHMRQAGDRSPYREREFEHRFFVFQVQAGEPSSPAKRIYLRLQSTNSLYLMATLWSPKAFAQQSASTGLHWGLYFGALLISLAFMIAMVAINRSRRYLALTAALLINAFHAANSQGFLAGTLWIDWPAGGDASMGVSAPWSIAVTLWTLREFLTRHTPLRWGDRFYLGATGLCTLAPLSLLFDFYGAAMRVVLTLNLLGIIGGLSLLAISQQAFGRAERVLAFSLGIYLVAYVIIYLPLLGLIPASDWLLWLRNSMFIFFSLLASAALLFEIRQTYRNLLREKSQALAISVKGEAALELQVVERTAALVSEISRRTALEAALRGSLEVEQQALADQRAFAGMISHEFRTPLAIVDTTLQQLEMNLQAAPEKTFARFRNAEAAVSRLAALIDDYLSLDRMQSGDQGSRMSDCELPSLLQRAVAELPAGRVMLDERDLPPIFVCDSELLRVALRNLLANAERHSAPAAVIELQAIGTNGGVCFTVSDAGEGISEAEMGQVFNKYFRGRAAQGKPGAGLGLYLVERIAHLHGGWVSVTSTPGVGSRFTLHLPQAVFSEHLPGDPRG